MADVDWPVDQVFVDGRTMVPARSPNLGDDWYKPKMLSIEAIEGECRVKGESWPEDFWTGGVLWGMNERAWVAVTRPIVGSDGNTLELEGRGPLRDGQQGMAVLTGTLAALDAEREWHQQNGRLYLWMPGGGAPDVTGADGEPRWQDHAVRLVGPKLVRETLPEHDFYGRYFNNGVGLTVIVPEEAAEDLLERLRAMDENAHVIGEVIERKSAGERVVWT